MSVSMNPGAIAFTWILNFASLIAMDFVSCTKAPGFLGVQFSLWSK